MTTVSHLQTHTRSEQGVLYCATQDDGYLAQAFVAARSVKRHMPGIPIALFTDMAAHPLVCRSLFDHVFDIRIEHRFASTWATGKLPRITALTRSPFDKTLHLDCDTRITDASARQIFSFLDIHDIAMVECRKGESFSTTHSGWRMFNGGMVAFRKSPDTQGLFERWSDLTLSHHQMGNTIPLPPPPPYLTHITNTKTLRRLLKMDQISLAQYLSPDVNILGLKILTLDETWNARSPARMAGAGHIVKINHAPENRRQAWENLSREAASIAREGNAELHQTVLHVIDTHQATPRRRGAL